MTYTDYFIPKLSSATYYCFQTVYNKMEKNLQFCYSIKRLDIMYSHVYFYNHLTMNFMGIRQDLPYQDKSRHIQQLLYFDSNRTFGIAF